MPEQELVVTFAPHLGQKSTPRGKIPVQFDQDLVYLNGTHVGYLGHQVNAPLNTIVKFDPLTAERLHEEVRRQRANAGSKLGQPVSAEDLSELAAHQAAEEFDDEDFDDE